MSARVETSVEDTELLRRYAEQGDGAAFGELVRRRIGLVYSVALRHTHGDRHRAEDATQVVFSDLARKAKALSGRAILGGWLYRSAQFAATGLVRAEMRRQAREQAAHLMQTATMSDGPEPEWEKLRPVLDEALNEMDERDRDAIVLRFFDGRSFVEIGQRLRLTDNAARMRVDRAVDRLQGLLARRGITSTTAAVGIALAQQVTTAAPVGLASSVTGAVLLQAASSGGWATILMSMTKLQSAILGATALTGVSIYLAQAQTNSAVRDEIAALRTTAPSLEAMHTESRRLADAVAEAELLRGDDAEFRRLEQRVAEARQAQQQRTRAAALAAQSLTEERASAEVDRMNREGNALVVAYKAQMERSRDATLTPAARAEAAATAAAKMAEVKSKQLEIQDYLRRAKAADPDSESRVATNNGGPTWRAAEPAMSETSAISVNFPGADYQTVLTAYEKLGNVKISQDASLADVRGVLQMQGATGPRGKLLEQMRGSLREQLGIVLERAPDGSLVAKHVGAP